MSTLTPPARGTLPLRVPWATVVIALGVAGFVALRELLLPASADSMLTIRLLQLALAAGAAYLLDDASAALTAVAPRPLWLHRAFPLAVGLLAIASSWSVVLLDLRQSPGTPLRTLTLEVSVLVFVALAASAVMAACGEAEPGNLVAIVIPLTGVGANLTGAMLGFEVFLSGEDSPVKATAWVAGGVLALAILVQASRDRSGRGMLRRQSGTTTSEAAAPLPE